MLLVPYILYKWSDLILRGKIPILMSLGEDLGHGETNLKHPSCLRAELPLSFL